MGTDSWRTLHATREDRSHGDSEQWPTSGEQTPVLAPYPHYKLTCSASIPSVPYHPHSHLLHQGHGQSRRCQQSPPSFPSCRVAGSWTFRDSSGIRTLLHQSHLASPLPHPHCHLSPHPLHLVLLGSSFQDALQPLFVAVWGRRLYPFSPSIPLWILGLGGPPVYLLEVGAKRADGARPFKGQCPLRGHCPTRPCSAPSQDWAHLGAVPIPGQGLCPPHLLHFNLVGNKLLSLVGEGLSGRQLRKAADLLHIPALEVGGAGHPGTHSVETEQGQPTRLIPNARM